MSAPLPIGVIGAGRHAQALVAHGAAFGRIRVAAWSASPDGSDADAAAHLAGSLRPWQDVAADPSLAAVLLLGSTPAEAAEIALRHGAVVLCPPAAAPDPATLSRLQDAASGGGGRLVLGGELAHGEAAGRALAMIRDEALGALRSLFLSVRQPRGDGPDILDSAGWEALDFVLAALPAPLARIQASGAALFGPARDTVSALLRCADEVVVTLELSRCLPPTLPAPGLGEIEIEAFGTAQAIRATPHAEAVRIHADGHVAAAPWLDPPVVGMLAAVAASCDGARPCDLPRAAATLAAMTALRAAIGAADAVKL